jgi:Ulp1 family protease
MKHAFENDEEDEEDSLSSSGGWEMEEEDEHDGQYEAALDEAALASEKKKEAEKGVNALKPLTALLTENHKDLQAALTAPLTAEQEKAVKAALAPGLVTDVLASGWSHFADLKLKRGDVAKMAPGEWLNDTMVNFTLGAMVAREARRVGVGADGSTQSQPRTHFMSTFFTKKLCGGEAYDYNAVRQWTTVKKLGYDALACDTIIVPVHQGIHWVLATVELREKRVRLYDSMLGEDHFLLDCLKHWVRHRFIADSDISILCSVPAPLRAVWCERHDL